MCLQSLQPLDTFMNSNDRAYWRLNDPFINLSFNSGCNVQFDWLTEDTWCWLICITTIGMGTRSFATDINILSIDYLRFYVPLKNFSLIWRRHHSRWRAVKFRPMLGAQGLLSREGSAVIRDLGFSGLIQSPLTTHEGM
jgi:hypothetical protein